MASLAKCLQKANELVTDFDRQDMIDRANILRERGYTDSEAQETVVREKITDLERERTDMLRQAETQRHEIERINENAWKKGRTAEGQTVARVDPRKLMDAYLQQDDPFAKQIANEAEQMENGFIGRTARVDKSLRAGNKLEPPMLFAPQPGRIDFQDGRHRMLWGSMNAVDSIPIITDFESLKNLSDYLVDSLEIDIAKTAPTRADMLEEQKQVLGGRDLVDFIKDIESAPGAAVDAPAIYAAINQVNSGIQKETIDRWLVDRAENEKDLELVSYPEGTFEVDVPTSIMDGAFAYQSVMRTKTADYQPKDLMTELTKADAAGQIIDYLDNVPTGSNIEVAHEMGQVALHNPSYAEWLARQVRNVEDKLSDARQADNFGDIRIFEQLQKIYEEAHNFVRSYKTNAQTPAYMAAQRYKRGLYRVGDKHLRRAVLGEKYERSAYEPASLGITLEQVQKMFPGQQVSVNDNGEFTVKTRAGRGVVIRNVDVIDVDRVAFNSAYGRLDSRNELIAGKYHNGVIEIRKDNAGDWVLAHESFHWMEDAGIISVQDADILAKEIQRLHSAGKFTPTNPAEVGGAEDRANFVAANLARRTEFSGPVRKILDRIAEWLDRFLNLFTRTSRGVIRDIQTGTIHGNVRGPAGIAQFPAYQASAWHGSGAFFKKFLSRFIGTGEGAQMFGWGLYFTGVEGIGRHYADKLGKSGIVFKNKMGKMLTDFLADMPTVKNFIEGAFSRPATTQEAIEQIEKYRQDAVDAADHRRMQLNEWKRVKGKIDRGAPLTRSEQLTRAVWEKRSIEETEKEIRTLSEHAEGFNFFLGQYNKGAVEVDMAKNRNLYQVTLWKGKQEGTDYHLLDWYEIVPQKQMMELWDQFKKTDYYDADYLRAVSKFPADWSDATVRDEIRRGVFGLLGEPAAYLDTRASDFYRGLVNVTRRPKAASMLLKKMGIDGIRYPTETLVGGPRRIDVARKVAELSAKQAETLAATMNEMGYATFDLSKPGSQLLPEMKIDLAVGGFADRYQQALRRLNWIEPTYNYVVFDENDITIDQVEQYQAIKQPGIQPRKQRPPQYMAKTEEEKDFEAAEANKEEAKQFNKEYPAAITYAYKLVGDVWRNRNEGWKDPRPDTSVWDRILSLPTHYFQKVPALKKVLDAGLSRHDIYYNLVNQLENMPSGDSFLKKLHVFKRKNKKQYRQINSYLVRTDLNRTGFAVKQFKVGAKTVWGVMDRNGKRYLKPDGTALTYENENDAVAAMIAVEGDWLVQNRGFTPEMAQIVGYFRATTNNGFNLLAQNIRNIRRRFQEAGRELPKVAYFDQAEKIMVDLNVALAMMGDLRGTYFPRIRQPGRFTLYATKKGTNPILLHFDSQLMLNRKFNELQDQGYTVERNYASKLPEDVFELGGSIIALQTQINAAFDKAKQRYDEAVAKKLSQKQLDAQSQQILQEVIPQVELEFAKAITEQVANQIKARGVRAHMIGRNQATGSDVWKGYEEDAVTSLGLYVRGVAAGEAKRQMSVNMMRGFTGTDIPWSKFQADYETYVPGLEDRIEREYNAGERKKKQVMYKDYIDFVRERRVDQRTQPNAYRDGSQYMLDMLRNDEAADRIMGQVRGIATLKYLAGRIAAPFVNLTALPTSTVAAMNGMENISINRGFRLIGRGMNGYRRYTFGDKAEMDRWDRKLYDHIINQGWHEAQYNKEALSVLKSKVGRGWDNVINVSMYLFGASEKINRTSTIAGTFMGIREKNMAEWNAANDERKQQLLEQWSARAKAVSDAAHGVYGKENRPSWARGSHVGARLAQSFYVFKTFSHNYLLTMKRFGFKNPKATLWMVASPAILAGAGASVATPVLANMLRALGLGGEDPEENFYKFVEENLGKVAGETARDGLFGTTLGIATKGSLAIGITDLPTNIADFLGAPYSMAEDIVQGFQQIGRGNVMKATEKFVPNFMAAPIKALREYKQGVTSNTNTPYFYGTEPIRLTLVEALIRAASFNPARVAAIRERQWRERKVEQRFSEMRTDIYAKLKAYMLKEPDKRRPEEYLEILKEMQEYNERVRASGLVIPAITGKSIRSNLRRAFRPPKKERLRGRQ